MTSADRIREDLDLTPARQRIALLMKSGERLWLSSRRRSEGDVVTVWADGERRTIDVAHIDQVEFVVSSAAALA